MKIKHGKRWNTQTSAELEVRKIRDVLTALLYGTGTFESRLEEAQRKLYELNVVFPLDDL